jgi:DnaJ-domain-containing protein 1
MVMDHFALLAEPRRPWLDAEALKSKFHTLSAEVHPDRVHEAAPDEKLAAQQRYTDLNAAFQCLREPRTRLRHLLELELGAKPSDLTNVPEDLMNLFFAVGKQLRETDALLTEKATATSPLLQVELFERAQVAVGPLRELQEQIVARRDLLLAQLKAVDARWETTSPRPTDELLTIWRWLSFYDRWLGQLHERVAQLSF